MSRRISSLHFGTSELDDDDDDDDNQSDDGTELQEKEKEKEKDARPAVRTSSLFGGSSLSSGISGRGRGAGDASAMSRAKAFLSGSARKSSFQKTQKPQQTLEEFEAQTDSSISGSFDFVDDDENEGSKRKPTKTSFQSQGAKPSPFSSTGLSRPLSSFTSAGSALRPNTSATTTNQQQKSTPTPAAAAAATTTTSASRLMFQSASDLDMPSDEEDDDIIDDDTPIHESLISGDDFLPSVPSKQASLPTSASTLPKATIAAPSVAKMDDYDDDQFEDDEVFNDDGDDGDDDDGASSLHGPIQTNKPEPKKPETLTSMPPPPKLGSVQPPTYLSRPNAAAAELSDEDGDSAGIDEDLDLDEKEAEHTLSHSGHSESEPNSPHISPTKNKPMVQTNTVAQASASGQGSGAGQPISSGQKPNPAVTSAQAPASKGSAFSSVNKGIQDLDAWDSMDFESEDVIHDTQSQTRSEASSQSQPDPKFNTSNQVQPQTKLKSPSPTPSIAQSQTKQSPSTQGPLKSIPPSPALSASQTQPKLQQFANPASKVTPSPSPVPSLAQSNSRQQQQQFSGIPAKITPSPSPVPSLTQSQTRPSAYSPSFNPKVGANSRPAWDSSATTASNSRPLIPSADQKTNITRPSPQAWANIAADSDSEDDRKWGYKRGNESDKIAAEQTKTERPNLYGRIGPNKDRRGMDEERSSRPASARGPLPSGRLAGGTESQSYQRANQRPPSVPTDRPQLMTFGTKSPSQIMKSMMRENPDQVRFVGQLKEDTRRRKEFQEKWDDLESKQKPPRPTYDTLIRDDQILEIILFLMRFDLDSDSPSRPVSTRPFPAQKRSSPNYPVPDKFSPYIHGKAPEQDAMLGLSLMELKESLAHTCRDKMGQQKVSDEKLEYVLRQTVHEMLTDQSISKMIEDSIIRKLRTGSTTSETKPKK